MEGKILLVDEYGREITYLRISVTERCNFRCQYCMPDKPFSLKTKENILSVEELFWFVKIAIDMGITKIRITGGEPLLRSDLEQFIRMISQYNNELDLSLSTNGFLLKNVAKKLKNAGLKRVNVSLDSLKLDVATKIAQKNVLESVKAGIDEALKVGLIIKINMVPIKGINANEVLNILEYAKERDICIRFIEYMENTYAKEKLQGLSTEEIQVMIAYKYSFKAIGRISSSPAQCFKMDNGYVFGIIAPHQHNFCEDCNRIRLTAAGMLIPCLYFDKAMSIKEAIQNKNIKIANDVLKKVINNKPEKNKWSEGIQHETSNRAFYETGG